MMNLRKYLKRSSKEESGFTLIELMVVVVILGILGSLVVPRIMSGVTTDATENTKKANIKMLQAAVDRYALDTGNTVDDWNNSTLKTNLTTATGGKGPWVDDVPTGYYVDDGIVKAGADPTP